MRLLKSTSTSQTTTPPTVANVPGILRIATPIRPNETVGGAVAPAPPKFTILKRPSSGSQISNPAVASAPSPFDDDTGPAATNNNSPVLEQSNRDLGGGAGSVRRAPVKSLEQRKQEYAEARLRILGDAKFSDDDDDETEKVATKTAGHEPPQRPHNNSRGGGTGGGRVNNHNNNSNPNNHNNRGGYNAAASQYHPPRPPPVFNASVPPPRFDPVIRVPRGPDGTLGFQSRR